MCESMRLTQNMQKLDAKKAFKNGLARIKATYASVLEAIANVNQPQMVLA